MHPGELQLRLADAFIVGYLSFAVAWPLLWDKLPRAARLLRRVGLFHRWDMMLTPSNRGYSVVVMLAYADGTTERRELPINRVYRTCLANRLYADRSLARHVLAVSMGGLWIDGERELIEAQLVLVEHTAPGLGCLGVATTKDHVLARGAA